MLGATTGAHPWLRLLPWVAGSLILAGLAFSNVLGNVLADVLPAVASRQIGADPIALIVDVDGRAVVEGGASIKRDYVSRAREAIRRQAFSPAAVVMLALAADARHAPDTERLYKLADAMSRHHLIPELWILERQAQAGSIEQTLVQYDILLRQFPTMDDMAYPVLQAGLSDPQIKSVFATYILPETPWMSEFLGRTAAFVPHPEVLATALIDTGTVGRAVSSGLQLSTLFGRLVEVRRFDLARRLYLSARAGPAELLSDVALNSASLDPNLAPISWGLTVRPYASAVASSNGDTMSLHINAGNVSADVAQKLLFLVPGRYRLTQKLEVVRGSAQGVARWAATCLGPSGVMGISQGPNLLDPAEAGRPTQFTIPVCDAVMLSFAVDGGEDQGGAELRLSDVALAKAEMRAATASSNARAHPAPRRAR